MNKKKKPNNRKKSLITNIFNKNNLSRDVIVTFLATILALTFIGISKWHYLAKKDDFRRTSSEVDYVIQNHAEEEFQKQVVSAVKLIQDENNIENWKNYKGEWYGFQIKYPQEWSAPKIVASDGAEYRYRFSSGMVDELNGKYLGFEVAIYNIDKIKELTNTTEFPKLKDTTINSENCKTIEGHLIETGDYIAEEIYVPAGDNCYDPTLFFTVTQGQYIYNVVPVLGSGKNLEGDPMIEVADNLPAFFAAIATFENIEIVRPKPKPKSVIKAPMPVSYKKDNLGRLVCAKKGDKPSKSEKTKKKHLDMQCCLDPDEYPNPHCYYPPEKYGKYLK